ncbi:MAG: hypothetical protein Q7S17_09985 [Xanthobacteraceae bacterium]|nr:hypothetical protein [Xanthobacteraceae bacterium]
MTHQIGQKVKCNGFDGTITEVCTGQLKGMVVVRLASGSVCVSARELDKEYHVTAPKVTGSGRYVVSRHMTLLAAQKAAHRCIGGMVERI